MYKYVGNGGVFSTFVNDVTCHYMALQAYEDGKTSMYIHERKATIKEFYGSFSSTFIFYFSK